MNSAFSRVWMFGLFCGIAGAAQAALSTLSPFHSKEGPPVAVATESSPIELRGVIMTPSGWSFGFYEPATQKGRWVQIGEKGEDLVVRSYDEAKAAVAVEYQGRAQTLVLKEATFAGSAQPVMASQRFIARTRPGSVPPLAPPPALNHSAGGGQLEKVAGEVARRRAARQAAQRGAVAPAPSRSGP